MKSKSINKHFFKLLLIFQLVITPKLFSQNIAINTTGNTPDTSAMLDISSTSQGFLMPRMTTTQMNTITLPATGLLIFNTSLNVFEVNLGTTTSPDWTPIGTSQTGWSTTGNSGTNSGSNFLGTTDNHALKFKVNNQLGAYIDSSGGNGNAFLGYTAGAVSTGTLNTFIGTQSGKNNTSGSGNTLAGWSSGYSITTAQANSFVGQQAGYNVTTGNYNVGMGYQTLYGNPLTGSNNVGIGSQAGAFLSSGNNNVAIGNTALYSNNTNQNIAIGNSAGYNASSDSSLYLGYKAGTNTGSGTGIFIGNNAGATNTSGTNILIVGHDADVISTGLSNATAIGNYTKVGSKNSMVLGDTTTGSAVNVGIGVRNPLKRLHIDAATIGSPGTKDSLKIDNLASMPSLTNKTYLVIDTTTGYVGRVTSSLVDSNFWARSPIGTGKNILHPKTIGDTIVIGGSNTVYNARFNVYGTSNFYYPISVGGAGAPGPYAVTVGLGAGGSTGGINVGGLLSGTPASTTHSTYNQLYLNFTDSINANWVDNSSALIQSDGAVFYGNSATGYNSNIRWGGVTSGGGYLRNAVGYNANISTNNSGNIVKYKAFYSSGNTPGAQATNNAYYAAFEADSVQKTTTVYGVNQHGNNTINRFEGSQFQVPNLPVGSSVDNLVTDSAGTLRYRTLASVANNMAWSLVGNSGTTAGTNFIGTTDNTDVVFKRNNSQSGLINTGNTSFGYGALNAPIAGGNDVAIGALALGSNTTGIGNTAIGYYAEYSNTTGFLNTATGTQALYLNTSGTSNTANGYEALYSNTTGYNNSAIGYQSLLSNTTGKGNTANGFSTLSNNTTGAFNTANGYQALGTNIIGNYNVANGFQALVNNTIGYYNTANGSFSLYSSTAGSNNVADGDNALYSSTGGYGNTAIGNSAGSTNITGSKLTLIGDSADVSTTALTNATAIGAYAKVGASNSLVLGGTGANAVKVGIGTTTPAHQLHVVGEVEIDTLLTGLSTDSIVTTNTGILRKVAAASLTSNAWNLTGNSGTNSNINFLGTTDNTSLYFRTNNQNRVKIDSVGYVGIGTTTPLNTLHIVATNSPNNRYSLFDAPNGTGENAITAFRNISALATGNQALIGFTNNGTSGFGANWGMGSIRTGNSNISGYEEDFIVENSLGGSYIERLRVTNSGNVGIGTSMPSSTLQVAGSVSTAIVTTDSSYTLSSSDYTVIFTGNATTAPTFTLPNPTTCKGRTYRLMNASSTSAYQDITLSMPIYLSNGNSTTLLSMNNFPTGNSASDPSVANTATIQSDGTIWWRVGL